jgi:hypothetical protein
VKEHSPTERTHGIERARAGTRWLVGGAVALSVFFPWAVWRALPGKHAAAKTSGGTSITVQDDPGLLPPDQAPSAPQDNQPQSVPQQQQQRQPTVVSGGS